MPCFMAGDREKTRTLCYTHASFETTQDGFSSLTKRLKAVLGMLFGWVLPTRNSCVPLAHPVKQVRESVYNSGFIYTPCHHSISGLYSKGIEHLQNHPAEIYPMTLGSYTLQIKTSLFRTPAQCPVMDMYKVHVRI